MQKLTDNFILFKEDTRKILSCITDRMMSNFTNDFGMPASLNFRNENEFCFINRQLIPLDFLRLIEDYYIKEDRQEEFNTQVKELINELAHLAIFTKGLLN